MLDPIEDNDYRLHEGGYCWVEVGNLVVYLAHGLNGVHHEIYEIGSEMDSPLHAGFFPFPIDEPPCSIEPQ